MPTVNKKRYGVPRRLLSWSKTPELKVLKMLAWAVKNREQCGERLLWDFVSKVCPKVMLSVIKKPYTLEEVAQRTLKDQGIPLTKNRLLQRADKTKRNKEFNEFKIKVLNAYLKSVGHANVPAEKRDKTRSFSRTILEQVVERQGGNCVVPTCGRKFDWDLIRPVGDHLIPWSKGGRTTIDNCVAMCPDCNSQKSDTDFLVFVARHAVRQSRGRT